MDITKLDKAQLLQLARKAGLKIYKKNKKPEILQHIAEHAMPVLDAAGDLFLVPKKFASQMPQKITGGGFSSKTKKATAAFLALTATAAALDRLVSPEMITSTASSLASPHVSDALNALS